MHRMTRILVVGSTVALIALVPSVASAKSNEEAEEPTCDDKPEVTYDPYRPDPFPHTASGASATVTIRTDDGLDTCEPVEVVLVSYTAEGPTWPTSGHQDAYDHDVLSTTNPGVYTLSVSWPDTCFFQIDMGEGTSYPQVIEYPVGWGPSKLLAFENGKTPGGCDEPKPTPAPNPPPNHNNNHHHNNGNNHETHHGTATHGHELTKLERRQQRYGGTAMTGTREEVIRWCLFLIFSFVVVAAASLIGSKKVSVPND